PSANWSACPPGGPTTSRSARSRRPGHTAGRPPRQPQPKAGRQPRPPDPEAGRPPGPPGAGPGRPGGRRRPGARTARDCAGGAGAVRGRRGITRALGGRGSIPDPSGGAAVEVMSRFAVDPGWLISLPPTMAPVPASTRPGLLEHPADALDAYRRAGVTRVICEEKHMGSRAIVIACRTPDAARDWFGSDRAGIVYTRTGRRFFADAATEEDLLARVTGALEKAGLWAGLGDWAALDCEIMPWSYKAGELVRGQYAAVG